MLGEYFLSSEVPKLVEILSSEFTFWEFLRKVEFLSLIQLVPKWLFSCGDYSRIILVELQWVIFVKVPPIEERVVTAIKLKRRRGGVLPIYHRASILDYENFWISRSDTILLNNKSPRNIHFFQNIHFFVMAYRSYFQNLSRGSRGDRSQAERVLSWISTGNRLRIDN